MRAFLKLYVSNMKEFSRDRMAIFWTMAFPVLFIVLFGIIFSGNGTTTYEIGLVVQDNGPVGTGLEKAFTSVPVLSVTVGNRDDLMAKLKQGDLRAVVVVPEGASGGTGTGKATALQTYFDPTNQVTSQIVLTIIQKVVDGVDRAIAQRPTLLTVQALTITSSSLRSIDFLLPGILAMSLMQLGLFATAPALVQLREQQVLRRIGATPLPRSTLLLSQVAHRLTIGLTQTLIIIVVGMVAFNVQMIGSWGELAIAVLVGAFMFVAMGYFISGLAKTQESVIGISQMINFPMMFLSGLFIPVAIMPAWIKPLVAIMPLTYLADALRQIMVGAPPDYPLALDMLILFVWLIICSVLAVRLFRWE